MDTKAFKDDPELLGRMLKSAEAAGRKAEQAERRIREMLKRAEELERKLDERESRKS